MYVFGVDHWYIAFLIGGNKFSYRKIERDEAMIESMLDIEKTFWNHVVEDIQPAVSWNDDVNVNQLFEAQEEIIEDEPAIITTVSISYEGKPIQITADIHEGGSIKVSVVDDKGTTVTESAPVIETITNKELSFDENLKLENVQLKFELVNSKLYSFRIRE